MRWKKDTGEEFDNLYDAGIAKINSYEWAYFIIEFDGLSEMESSNTIFYMQNHVEISVLDFIRWLSDRKIKFKLKYRYFGNATLKENIKAFLFISILNFKKNTYETLR
jgi:hypothetical protein